MTPLNILTTAEQKQFNLPPVFTGIDQKRYFTFPADIMTIAKTLKPHNIVFFLVMYGYFKATNKFYNRKFHQKDIVYVAEKVGVPIEECSAGGYKSRTYLNHRELVLKYTGFAKFDMMALQLLISQLTPLIRSHTKPKLMFQQACKILTKHKIEIPQYNTLSTFITQQIRTHQRELSKEINEKLNTEQKGLLGGLLNKNVNRYRLTLLKRFHQSMRPTKIRENVVDLIVLRELFENLKSVSQSLQLTNEGMKYYAYCMLKFNIFQVLRREDVERYLYLIAFINHQYYVLQDLLIDVLIQAVAGVENRTNKHQKDTVFALRKTRSMLVERVVNSFLKDKYLIKEVKAILASQKLTDTEKVQTLQQLFAQIAIPEEKDLEVEAIQLQKENKRILKDEDYYDFLEIQSRKLQNRVSEIVKQVRFNKDTSQSAIIAAIEYFGQKNGEVGNTAPLDFLEPEEQEAVFDDKGKLRVSPYKVLLFLHIAASIKSGELNLKHSYKYRSFDEYLIPKNTWEENKHLLLEQAGLTQFQDFLKLQKELAETLHRQYEITNQHILKGKNKYIKLYKNGEFSLTTPKEEDEPFDDTSLSDLFPKTHFVSLYEVLATVQSITGYVNVFDHLQTTHVGKKQNEKTFYAGIIGLGCNIGIKKFAKIATHINQSELETTVNWYFSPENIEGANDSILAFLGYHPDFYVHVR